MFTASLSALLLRHLITFLIGTLRAPYRIAPAAPTCSQSCTRGYHDKPETTGLHVNVWFRQNLTAACLTV